MILQKYLLFGNNWTKVVESILKEPDSLDPNSRLHWAETPVRSLRRRVADHFSALVLGRKSQVEDPDIRQLLQLLNAQAAR